MATTTTTTTTITPHVSPAGKEKANDATISPKTVSVASAILTAQREKLVCAELDSWLYRVHQRGHAVSPSKEIKLSFLRAVLTLARQPHPAMPDVPVDVVVLTHAEVPSNSPDKAELKILLDCIERIASKHGYEVRADFVFMPELITALRDRGYALTNEETSDYFLICSS